ncbi:MAG: M50 family metallopeptidase [Myxococcota bacterium]|nr:M50 family metallopeptidase [Myxococcota bacterium]
MSIIVAILGFNVLIVIHELGHYLLAKAVGMRASKFSIGFGPALFRVHGKETVFQVALLPLGGYVQLAGMGAGQEGDLPDMLGATPDSRDYNQRPLWQRALVVSAGPVFNFVFAIVTYAALFGSSQAVAFEWKREATTMIREVSGAAEMAGLKAYDVIEAVNGDTVSSFGQLRKIVGEQGHRPLNIKVARSPDGQAPPVQRIDTEFSGLVLVWPDPPASWPRETITVKPVKTERGYLVGIVPEFARFSTNRFADAIRLGCAETWTVTATIFKTLGRWIQGKEDAQVASVVKITEIGADTVKMGSEWFLSLLAILSVNLGLLNLLPFPALDGGRLVFIGIEAIARKPVPKRFELLIHGVGMLILMSLMLIVVAREIAEKFQ